MQDRAESNVLIGMISQKEKSFDCPHDIVFWCAWWRWGFSWHTLLKMCSCIRFYSALVLIVYGSHCLESHSHLVFLWKVLDEWMIIIVNVFLCHLKVWIKLKEIVYCCSKSKRAHCWQWNMCMFLAFYLKIIMIQFYIDQYILYATTTFINRNPLLLLSLLLFVWCMMMMREQRQ